MKRVFAITFSASLLLSSVCWAASEQTPLADPKAKDSYSLGYEFGENLKKQEIELDTDTLLSGIRDALDGKESALSSEEIRNTMTQLRQKVKASQERRYREAAAKNLEEGKAFLTDNGTKEGVKTLPSGLQYKVLQEGNGPKPKATDTVTVNYRGTLVNGTEFDSSYNRNEPATFQVGGVIKGWTEALQLMPTNSKWQIFVPAELAYGERQLGPIPANSTLIFEIELLKIGADNAPDAAEPKASAEPTSDKGDKKPDAGAKKPGKKK